VAAKKRTKKVYRDKIGYRAALDAHVINPDVFDEPEFDEVEIVDTVAVIGGKEVKVPVRADKVGQYEAVLAEHRARQKGGDK
jgi:hypothetical protein